MEQELEELWSRLTELEAGSERGCTNSDSVREDFLNYEEEETEPVVPRRRVQKNVAQQSASLSVFIDEDVANGTKV